MTRNFDALSYPRAAADTCLSCPDVNDPDAFAARVHGDYMQPDYQSGDIVIFSPRAEVRDGDECFVRLADGGTTFRAVYFEGDMIRLQPLSKWHRPKVVPGSEVVGIFPAVYRYSRVNVR